MKALLRNSVFALSGLAVAACSTDPPQALKPTEMPSAFTAPMTKSSQVWPTADWWTGFSSPELTDLEVTAQKENNDLAAAYARVLQARGNTGLEASALFPAVDLNASAQRSGSHVPVTSVGTTGTTTTTVAGVSGNSFGVSLSASYELDFWGLA